MQKRQLGFEGPEVTTVGFGAWAIGGMNWGPTDDQVSLRAIHQALDEGANFIDTADVYGHGHSEDLIAQVLRERSDRDRIIIATKAGNDFLHAKPQDDQGYGPIIPNYRKEYLISAAEASLRRLGLDCLPLLQLHSPSTQMLDESDAFEALAILKEQGKIRLGGLSIQSFRETEQTRFLAPHRSVLDVIQVRYNLLERQAEEVLFPEAQRLEIGVIIRIPLLFGFLTGKFGPHATFGPDDHRSMNLSAQKLQQYLEQLNGLAPLYRAHPEETKGTVALRFCISHPATTTVIPGGKTPEQVTQNCLAGRLGPLPPESLALLPPPL
jgi:aryl-alcohol dehydrogenase-like predicted oxidoreductase